MIMKVVLNIILYAIFWFLSSVLLLAFWVQSGGEITRMPIFYWAITLIVPYIIVYKYKLLDKFKNIKIPKASNNKKNDTHKN